MKVWHTKTKEQIGNYFGVGDSGLTAGQVNEHRNRYGSNTLPQAKTDSIGVIFLRQFQSPLIYILLAASVIIFFIRELTDAVIIVLILLFNAVVGTIQEGKAQNTLASLKQFVETKATVVRSGIEEIILDTEVVPGDILILREGDKIPADARVIESEGLTVDEAALTGESEPVYKTTNLLRLANLSNSDQKNMVFKGTHVVAGAGRAIVIATGLATVIGSISREIATIQSEDPLKRDVKKLSRLIIITVAVTCGTLFIFGILTGKPLKDMFTTVVSLSVSIIPEGLPIVLTLVLATGVWRMSKHNVLVKRLQAVESLGQAKIIAVDKTGTITANELVVRSVYADGFEFTVNGNGYEPSGAVLFEGKEVGLKAYPQLSKMAQACAFCANAKVAYNEAKQAWQVAGDPTEAALLVFAQKLGLPKELVEKQYPKVAEIPFSYQTKYHAVLHKTGPAWTLTIVGAPEKVMELSGSVWQEKHDAPLDAKKKEELEEQMNAMSGKGLRVLGVAVKNLKDNSLRLEDITDLTFLGFIGMQDTLRPEVKSALARAHDAGMKVVMITGDHKLTAEAIAKEAGILTPGSKVLTGLEIDALSDARLSVELAATSVFARVTPEHKLRIIQAYKARGEIIAMTGDGVNDAPSLVAADLGVAMGKIGTEVAKEAADIILLDDNFGSIVSAVEEGRSIYKTIKKVILYLFSTSFGEVLTIAGALVLGMPLPVLAVQIIWLNFVTDGFLDVSLAMEPKEKGLLNKNKFRGTTSLLDRLMLQRMLVMAVPMAIGSLLLFNHYVKVDLVKGWTVTMTVLAVFQWFNAWNCRNEKESIFKLNPFSNKFLIGSTMLVIVLQLFAVYHPMMQKFLRTTALSATEWLVIVVVASSIIVVEEIRKYYYRTRVVA